MSILQVNDLQKVYTTRFGGVRVPALTGVTFSVEPSEYVAIMGESGAGKTTLLNLLAALDKPTAGQILLDGKDLSAVPEARLAAFRRENLGFVFQDFNLLDNFTLEDNIYLPLVLSRVPYEEMHRRLMPLAKLLGISALLKKHPYEVSGPLLLPAGALDSHSTDELLNLLDQVNAQGQTILMVTHSVKAASHARRVLFIKDGKLFHQLYRGEADRAAFYQRIADTLTLIATGGEQNV